MSTSTTERYEELFATAELSEYERYHLLSLERRRVVCDVLAAEEPPISLERLASATASREDELPESDVDGDIKIALHHVHLPKLAEAGVIDYDTETRQVKANREDMRR